MELEERIKLIEERNEKEDLEEQRRKEIEKLKSIDDQAI